MKFNIIVIVINKNSNIFIHKYKTKLKKGFKIWIVRIQCSCCGQSN